MAASLYPFPRFVDADAAAPDPMTNPARQRLAEAIAALDRARRVEAPAWRLIVRPAALIGHNETKARD